MQKEVIGHGSNDTGFRENEVAANFRAVDDRYRDCPAAGDAAADFQAVCHPQSTCLRSVVDNLVDLCHRDSIMGSVRLTQSKARHLRRQHNRAGDEFADGERHPDARRMDLLIFQAVAGYSSFWSVMRSNAFGTGPLEPLRFKVAPKPEPSVHTNACWEPRQSMRRTRYCLAWRLGCRFRKST